MAVKKRSHSYLGSCSEMIEPVLLCLVEFRTAELSELLESRLIDTSLVVTRTCSDDCANLQWIRRLIGIQDDRSSFLFLTVARISGILKLSHRCLAQFVR